VGSESDQKLAIRTIAVSARAAIESSSKIGRPDAAAECARRGLTMLEGLREQLGPDLSPEVSQVFDAAVRDLASAADASGGTLGSGVREETRRRQLEPGRS
jgi:hypothetical protein